MISQHTFSQQVFPGVLIILHQDGSCSDEALCVRVVILFVVVAGLSPRSRSRYQYLDLGICAVSCRERSWDTRVDKNGRLDAVLPRRMVK